MSRKFAGIIGNDIVDGVAGLCVSFWTQGCPHRCPGCHNPETWSFTGGEDLPDNYIQIVLDKLSVNNVHRDLSILGGEPLCEENVDIIYELILSVRKNCPSTKINLWTGYYIEDLVARKDIRINYILSQLCFLIDGPFIQEQRNINLELRGSSNQRVLNSKEIHKALKRSKTCEIFLNFFQRLFKNF